jgi:hypothetical protein
MLLSTEMVRGNHCNELYGRLEDRVRVLSLDNEDDTWEASMKVSSTNAEDNENNQEKTRKQKTKTKHGLDLDETEEASGLAL